MLQSRTARACVSCSSLSELLKTPICNKSTASRLRPGGLLFVSTHIRSGLGVVPASHNLESVSQSPASASLNSSSNVKLLRWDPVGTLLLRLFPDIDTPLNLCRSLSLASITAPGSRSLPEIPTLSRILLSLLIARLASPKVAWLLPESRETESRSGGGKRLWR